MPSIPLHTSPLQPKITTNANSGSPFPQLLQTPSGLALLEIQGTIHAPFPQLSADDESSQSATQTSIGRLEFPLYDPSNLSSEKDDKWMKTVYLYVGKHQRLVGEVRKLPKAMAIVRKRELSTETREDWEEEKGEELEIAEIVRWKILFAGRPEPVGGEDG